MDRFMNIHNIVENSISTNVDRYVAVAMESHINDLEEMTTACEAFDVKGGASKVIGAIKQFAIKAGRRIMDLVNSIISNIDQLITRIANSSHRKAIQVPKNLKTSYDEIARFIIDVSKESIAHVNLMVECSNLQRLLSDPDATNEMMVARAKLMDYNRDAAERLQKIGASSTLKELNESDWHKSKATEGGTVPFNPSLAQKVLNDASKYWKNVRARVQNALKPINNYGNTLNAASKFMKDGQETDDVKRVVGTIRNLVGGTYSATMNLASGMLRGISMLSKTIAAFIAIDKKVGNGGDVVEGQVVEKKEPERKPEGARGNRVKALPSKAEG